MKTEIVLMAVALLVLVGFSSCDEDEEKIRFTEKELGFVSYEKNEDFKVIDTSGVVQKLKQKEYSRRFHETSGFLIYNQETYRVSYLSDGAKAISLSLYVSAQIDDYRGGDLAIRMLGMVAFAQPNSLPAPTASIAVNGTEYKNVHVVKAQPAFTTVPWPEATIFWNREYGFIQLVLPNGKSITRID
jgi:hypothetical protein